MSGNWAPDYLSGTSSIFHRLPLICSKISPGYQRKEYFIVTGFQMGEMAVDDDRGQPSSYFTRQVMKMKVRRQDGTIANTVTDGLIIFSTET